MSFARSGKEVSQQQRTFYFSLCRKLGMSDELRRVHLKTVAGVSSTTKLTRSSMARVIDDLLIKSGKKPNTRPSHEATKAGYMEPENPARLIKHLSNQLGWSEDQLMRWLESSRSPLARWNKFRPIAWNIEKLHSRQSRTVIEALKRMVERKVGTTSADIKE